VKLKLFSSFVVCVWLYLHWLEKLEILLYKSQQEYGQEILKQPATRDEPNGAA
jgi:hypothetical protein